MSSVDNRVVQMQFDNASFEAGVKSTLASLDALNKSLKLEGATKGLEDVSNASGKVDLGRIATAAEAVSEKFRAMSLIAISVLSNIATKAIDVAAGVVKSFSLAPVMDGFHEYETNLNAIQTILANTGLTGQAGLAKVNDALNVLNKYSDQTIFNFSEMARNIGTFTAAGVTLDVATQAIKGISNLAAISGSSADQASTAMYQLSQAISAGKVSLEDWNSVVNAGMGGKVFQNALIETARVHGVAIDQMIKDEGSFRLTLQNGWLSSQILTETLSKFTGDLTAAQLKTMGYNDQQIAGILQMAKTAQEAATKVKTFSQLIDTLKEAVGSGWSQTFQILFGDFNEARDLFTSISNVLGAFISTSSNARNSVLQDWKDLGGRTALINSISNAFQALIAVVTPIKDAFKEIFPPVTGLQLDHLTVSLENFTATLKIGADTADNLKRTFAGVFAAFGIGWDVIKGLAGVLADLFGMASKGSGGILAFTGNIGDFIVALKKSIEAGDGLSRFFGNIEKILAVPVKLIQMAAEAIGHLFSGFDGSNAESDMVKFVAKASPVAHIAQVIIDAWSKLPEGVSKAWQVMQPVAEKLMNFFSKLGTVVKDAFAGINFDTLFQGVAVGGLTTLLVTISGFIKKLKAGVDTEGLLKTITEPFEALTTTLKTMQNTLKAATLLEIAGAIALLTIAVVGLSKVDSEGLTRALTAIGVLFTQLIATMFAFSKAVDSKETTKLIVLGAALILLATAVDILTAAVERLSSIPWKKLNEGLAGLTIILAELIVTVNLMPNEAKMVSTSTGLLILSAAIQVLVSAVTTLSGLSWSEMAKGLVGVGSLLASLTLFTKFAEADKAGVLQGAGLLLLAVAIKILAGALSDLGSLSWSQIGKGLTTMAGGLTLMAAALILIPPSSVLSAAAILVTASSLGLIADALDKMGNFSWSQIGKGLTELAGALTLIALALDLIPPTSLLSAAAIFVTAASLGMITDALQQMGNMSWGEIGKSLVELAGALTIIALATTAMIVALPGAAALIVVAGALAILAPVLQLFGDMSWEEMGKGLLMLAGIFVVLAAAGILLTPVVPSLLGLGVAITLLGVGTLAAGVGVLAFATGLTALSVAGGAATVVLVGMVSALAGLIPIVLSQIANGLVQMAVIIGQAGPQITQAVTAILLAIISAINQVQPQIIQTLIKMLALMLSTLLKYEPQLVDTGIKLIVGFLNGVAKNQGDVITAAVNVAIAFIRGIQNNQPRVIQAGVDFIIAYINGLASAIKKNSGPLGDAAGNLATAIIEGMIRGLASGASRVASEAASVAKKALNAALSVLGIHSPSREFMKVGLYSAEGMAVGFEQNSGIPADAAAAMADKSLARVKTALASFSDAVELSLNTDPVITPVLDLTQVRRDTAAMNALFPNQTISFGTTASKANDASLAHQTTGEILAANADASTSSVTYNQYNNSPKALSTADIYRQTKNQLSVTKGVVTKNA